MLRKISQTQKNKYLLSNIHVYISVSLSDFERSRKDLKVRSGTTEGNE